MFTLCSFGENRTKITLLHEDVRTFVISHGYWSVSLRQSVCKLRLKKLLIGHTHTQETVWWILNLSVYEMPIMIDCKLSNSMDLVPSLYASSTSARHISRTLWNVLGHCCIGNRLPLVPNQCQISPVHGFPDDWSSLIILSCLHLGLRRGPFPSGIKTVYVLLLSSVQTTCPAHLILDLFTRLIFGDQSTSRHSSLWNSVQCPAKVSL